MLSVEPFRYGDDNLGYVIYGTGQAMAVDGGAWEEILAFLRRNHLLLSYVTNTHGHFDHTPGNDSLLGHTKAALLSFEDLPDGREILLDGGKVSVLRTPGHSLDSVCFYTGAALVSGDTLFNGTVGNCFTGDLKAFYRSIKRIMTLPPETLIYAGHDYVRDALAFAAHLEPDNPAIERYRQAYDSQHVCSSLAEELAVNPYLRFNETPIVELLEKLGLPAATEWERWHSLMSID